MAAYHFTSKVHSRGKGASAVRAAAYRAAERIHDARLGVTEDYSRKADVVETAILLPEGVDPSMAGRAKLWNAVEAREARRDAQVAQDPDRVFHLRHVVVNIGFAQGAVQGGIDRIQ